MDNKLTQEMLEDFLEDLSKSPKGKKIIDDLEYWSVKDLGNGLYQCGNCYFGKRGLEELDKALREKAKSYGEV